MCKFISDLAGIMNAVKKRTHKLKILYCTAEKAGEQGVPKRKLFEAAKLAGIRPGVATLNAAYNKNIKPAYRKK